MDLGKLMSLLFNTLSRFLSFLSKEQVSFNFMAAVTIYKYVGNINLKIKQVFFKNELNWGLLL